MDGEGGVFLDRDITDAVGNRVLTLDYGFAQQLIHYGADPSKFQLGIIAEETKGGGYKLRMAPFQDPPPYDEANPSTFAAAYGPLVPAQDLRPC